MSQDVPSNFSFVPSVGPANPFRLNLPFGGRRVTIYHGIDRLGHVDAMAEGCFRTFDPANKSLGPYPDMESAALGLWRAFLFAAEEVARIKAGYAPTPTFDRKEKVYAGGVLTGAVDVWNDGSAHAFDRAGKFLGNFPSFDLAVKWCHGEHSGEAGLSSKSLN
jgi:hypothetical protein